MWLPGIKLFVIWIFSTIGWLSIMDYTSKSKWFNDMSKGFMYFCWILFTVLYVWINADIFSPG